MSPGLLKVVTKMRSRSPMNKLSFVVMRNLDSFLGVENDKKQNTGYDNYLKLTSVHKGAG